MADKSNSIAYENLSRRLFAGVGEYDIPKLKPETFDGECEFVGFNYARGKVSNPEEKADKLSRFRYVLTPDFSMYTDFPKAIQIYNHYRKHWCGAYLQEYGCKVIPTISWSTPDSYEWCFDGEPEGGTVAVSSVGCMNGIGKKHLFLSGYNAMVERLHPESIIFYGSVPEECTGNIVRIKAFHEKFNHALCEV